MGGYKVEGGSECQGKQECSQGVTLKDTHGNVMFISVRSRWWADVGIECVEIGDKALIKKLSELLGKARATQ